MERQSHPNFKVRFAYKKGKPNSQKVPQDHLKSPWSSLYSLIAQERLYPDPNVEDVDSSVYQTKSFVNQPVSWSVGQQRRSIASVQNVSFPAKANIHCGKNSKS